MAIFSFSYTFCYMTELHFPIPLTLLDPDEKLPILMEIFYRNIA